jgi:alpha-glucosidase
VDRWWGGDGSFVDFTSSKAREVWKNKIKEQLLSKGATSIWNDNNEYNSIDNRAAICAHDN